MPALNFPTTGLYEGYQYTGDNGVTYIYDGIKWVGHAPTLSPGTSALVNNGYVVQLDGSGTLTLSTSSNALYTTTNALIKTFADIQISAGDDVGSNWIFGGDGELYLPTGGRIGATKGGTMLDGGFGSGASLTSFYASEMFSSCVTANANGTLNITTYGDGVGVGGQWLFGLDGSTSLPNGVAYKSSGTVLCAAGADTVVYTGTAQYQMTFKLLLKVEGIEGSNSTEDTQSTEMIVARGNRVNTVAASVYGVVHTSVSPLATFTAQWNAVTSLVEITCRPTSLTNSVTVIAFATEISTSH